MEVNGKGWGGGGGGDLEVRGSVEFNSCLSLSPPVPSCSSGVRTGLLLRERRTRGRREMHARREKRTRLGDCIIILARRQGEPRVENIIERGIINIINKINKLWGAEREGR